MRTLVISYFSQISLYSFRQLVRVCERSNIQNTLFNLIRGEFYITGERERVDKSVKVISDVVKK